ncbi:glycosyltransferase [Alteromonas sp. McT4-15]|uniref:glycosyltransferase family 2 protein n=1 Tax=Alteromonas sp. McT4-15 TaxID=2881256 RepID=UPI001CF86174|nr:galactosyltransferase-related protein [Alteromonas sp. McT4-15]MCB4435797.1 glycosyltransferase [Alteromonas sp. McT4-15]
MHMPVSVVTIVKNRTEKLCRLISQLEAGTDKPSELIVVWMAPPSELSLMKSDHFDIVHKFTTQQTLPIARARNKGMLAATYDTILYVNVEAIIAPTLVGDGVRKLTSDSVVFTSVKFVSEDLCRGSYNQLKRSHLELATGYRSSNDDMTFLENLNDNQQNQEINYGEFSNDSICSTVFFISKADFEKTGGFDESYTGFGLNDEDFFTTCRHLGLQLVQLETVTFVPERLTYRCPLNHLLDFVSNAQRFHHKWGFYPCNAVLKRYAALGYINNDFETQGLHVKHLPSEEEMRSSSKEKRARFKKFHHTAQNEVTILPTSKRALEPIA